MDEIEIKIEYNDTFDRDPLRHRPEPKHAGPSAHHDCADSSTSIPTMATDPEKSLFVHLPRAIPAFQPTIQAPITSLSLDRKKEDTALGNQPSKSQVTWFRGIDEFGKLKCKFCDLSYRVLQTLRVHVKKKHPKEVDSLKVDVKKSKRSSKLRCELCLQTFGTLAALKMHIKCKTNSMDYDKCICNYCKSAFLNKDDIIEHINKSHQKLTGNSFKKIHKKDHEPRKFQCPYCAHFAKRRYALTIHIRAKHKTDDDLKFSCSYCPYRTSVKYYLQNHVAAKHPESDYARSKQRYVCEICAYGTSKKSHYQQHRKKHSSNVREHKCEHCDFETNYVANLSVHRRIHTQEKPYLCGYEGCNYSCSAKSALNSHKIKHNPESYVWYCDKCNYKTIYKYSLKKHIDSHNRNRWKFL